MADNQPIDIERTSSSYEDDDTVILNVGGVKYEVRPSTLAQYPNTLLGTIFSPSNKHLRKPDRKGEYFFDRNGRIFEIILNFYRTGKLVVPPEMPQELVREELKYFKLDYDDGADSTDQENEDDKIMKQPRDQIFSYANSLIHSSSKFDIKRGLYFLKKLRELEPNNFLYRYSIAFSCYRLGYNREGIEVLEEILSTDPHNPQARSLMTLFTDSRISNTKLGILALVLLGAFGIWKLRSWLKGSPSSTSTSAAPSVSEVVSGLTNSSGGNAVNPSSVISGIAHTVATVAPVVASVTKDAVTTITETIPNAVVSTVTSSSSSSVPSTEIAQTIVDSISISNIEPVSSSTFLNALNSTK
eukprot:gene7441-9145_t